MDTKKDERGSGRGRHAVGIKRTPAFFIVVVALIILICWLPWIVLMQPTSMSPDTIASILWMRGVTPWDPSSHEILYGCSISDHHPVFDSLIYGAFDKIGRHFLGSDAAGFSLYGAIQAVLLAGSMAATVWYLKIKLSAPKAAWIAVICFYAIVPVFGCDSQVMVKDMTTMPFFMVWALMFVECVRRWKVGESYDKKFIVWLVVLSLLCALTKKTYVYIQLVSFVVLALATRRWRELLAPILVSPLVIFVVMGAVLFPLFHVAPGGIQEPLSVPLHQTAKAYLEHSDDMSESDKDAICAVLDVDSLDAVYTDASSDSVKDRAFNRGASRLEVVRYLGVWAKQAFAYPGSYLRAVSYLQPFFTPGRINCEPFCVRFGWEEFGGAEVMSEYPVYTYTPNEPCPSTPGQDIATNFIFTTIPNTPALFPLYVLEQAVLYNLVVPLFALAVCAYRRSGSGVIVLVPFLLCLLSLFASPAFNPRYGYVLMFCAPLILAAPFVAKTKICKAPDGVLTKM